MPDPTSVTVLLTDAPGDIAHAWVDIAEIYLQGGEGDEDGAGGRVILFNGPTGPIDLLELIDSAQEIAGDVVVPAGRYGQLRVVLDGAAIMLESGEIFATDGFEPPGEGPIAGELMCPSCSTSGFKVVLQGRELDLVDPEELLVLDFDAGESFVREAGMSGRWIVIPVIKLFDGPVDAGD
ncbi:MAG TPA: DUF4382 domain-containing protein [Gemmatimonadota bacterium]|nr:DUF4382 domain-containing protein [Gemmatimonadota bacterium]